MPRKNRGEKLTVAMVAEKLGILPSSWRAMQFRARQAHADPARKPPPGLPPLPDGQYDGRTPWWWESTIDAWNASRRGAGWRAGEGK